jgi:hypothetical protein
MILPCTSSITLPAPCYRWESESKIIQIAKAIFAILIFPIGIYNLLHWLAGKCIVPASIPLLTEITPEKLRLARQLLLLDPQWIYRRISIEVDGTLIDGMMVGKKETFSSNRKWLLASDGNSAFYEANVTSFAKIGSAFNANTLIFNYPEVGESKGFISRSSMAKTYRAFLSFLEDREKGINANEIIGFGRSIGGAVQADALLSHELKRGIDYTFIKDRTFSTLGSAVETITGSKCLAILTSLLGWNIDVAASSKKLKAPEIILQKADCKELTEIMDSQVIEDDGIIAASSSLAKALLEDPDCPRESKIFIGMPHDHNDRINEKTTRQLLLLSQRVSNAAVA